MIAAAARVIEFVDTTTRDGNQSLWSATGLTTPDVVAIAPVLDRVGYHALDFTSSTHMAVSVRFHREDPWERIRLMSAEMPNTPLGMIGTGMRFISWVPADEDVIALSLRLVARNGIRRFQIADPSNDPPRLRRLAAMARREGIEEVVIGLTYSISAVHTHEYYAERAAALADCADMDRLYLKDPGGLLTPDAVRELAPHFLAAAGGRTVELHSHCTIGLAPLVYVEGSVPGSRSCTRPPDRCRAGPRSPRCSARCATSRPPVTPTRSTSTRRQSCRSTSPSSLASRAYPRARRGSSTAPTTDISCRGGW